MLRDKDGKTRGEIKPNLTEQVSSNLYRNKSCHSFAYNIPRELALAGFEDNVSKLPAESPVLLPNH
jgi:hypothetical protein